MKCLAMGWIGAASVVAACVFASPSAAQVPFPPSQVGAYSQPGYSPYLNLLRPGSPAINYFGLVRPQVGYTNSIQGLQYQVNAVGTQVADSQQAQAPLVTGHTTGFMYFSRYFSGSAVRPAGGLGFARPVGNPVATGQMLPAAQGGRPAPPPIQR
jgi:hypothetical protein